MGINKAIIQGRLTADPELSKTGEVTRARFCVAVDDNSTDANGKRGATFINVTAWRATADFIGKYFFKGSEIIVEGRIRAYKYTDKNGNDRNGTEIVANEVYFCGSKKENAAQGRQTPKEYSEPELAPGQGVPVEDDGWLPF